MRREGRGFKRNPSPVRPHAVTLGEFDEAITEINRALSLDPLSSVMQSIRSFALFKSGRHDEAIMALTSVVQSDPGFASARMNLLGFLLMDGRYQEARRLAST